MQRIILQQIQKPKETNTYEDIEWLGESLGLSAGRDIERITAKILHNILDEISKKGTTNTEQISNNLDIETQRVNYHLRTLIDTGFIYREKRLIILRQGSVKAAVEEIRKDANRLLDELSSIAEEIDNNLGLKNRIKQTF